MSFGLCTRISDDPGTWIHPDLSNPIRKPGDDFQTIRCVSGLAIARGSNQGVLSDPRVYGKLSRDNPMTSWPTYFPFSNFSPTYPFFDPKISVINRIILDKSEDALCYEALGAWDELVTNEDGVNQFRTWNFRAGGREIYQRYPRNWQQYFARVEIYPRTPLGKF